MTSAALAEETVERDECESVVSAKAEKTTVLEALARHLARTGPNMSNQTTEPRNTDYDDQ
jgi:hypothetical protein